MSYALIKDISCAVPDQRFWKWSYLYRAYQMAHFPPRVRQLVFLGEWQHMPYKLNYPTIRLGRQHQLPEIFFSQHWA